MPPKHADSNRLLRVQGGEQVQLVRDDREQGRKFLARASPVLPRERPDRDLLDAQPRAPVDQLVELVRTGPVPGTRLPQPTQARPAAVAVENHGHVSRRGMPQHIAAESARVEAVDGCEKECSRDTSCSGYRAYEQTTPEDGYVR